MKLVNPLKLICLLTLLAGSIISCKKAKDEILNPDEKEVPQAVKDFMYFKLGTYWIYQDSITGDLDSTYVFSTKNGKDTSSFFTMVGYLTIISHYSVMETKSMHFNKMYKYSCYASKPTIDNYILTNRTANNNGLENIVFAYPLDLGKQFILNENTITIDHFYESLTVASNTFQDVYCISQTKDQTEDDSETKFYIAKNFGIIKKEISGRNENWKLIRSHIVQ